MKTFVLIAAALLLAGCASTPPPSGPAGFAAVEATTRERIGKELIRERSAEDGERIAARVRELLARPLAADDAVQLALLNHRGLQAAFAELGIAEADLVQAGRIPNPGFSFGRAKKGDEREIERGLHFSLGRLLAMPLVVQVEQRRAEATRAAVAAQVLALAADARKAWVQAVAAEQTLGYAKQVMDAAEASAELARRMAEVGNFSKLQQAREQSFYADAALNVARAEQLRLATRERLTRLLGLWGADTGFTLPERLPDLPAAPEDRPDIERAALAQRLDLQGARAAVEQTARNLGLMRRTRFVNVFELGFKSISSNEGPSERGWEVGFELPLFDWGGARVAKAEAIYMQAVQRAAQAAVEARSEVREAYGAYRHAWDIARHQRDEVVPLKQRISEENLLRYNAMLIGVFELLADARAQVAAVSAAIEAQRDFWLAEADLQMALVGKPSLMSPAGPGPAMAAGGGDPH